ncbi:hypothetical protein EMIT0111MI5_10741 [Burkholderia sp. IT-111MI5]
MDGIAMIARMPQRGDEDRGQADRDLEAAQPEGFREPGGERVAEARARHQRDQVGAGRDTHCIGVAGDDHVHGLARAGPVGRVVGRSAEIAELRCDHLTAGRIACGRDPGRREQRMSGARHRDVPVVTEHAGVQLGCVVAALADFQIDGAVAQRLRIAVGLGHEADAHVRRDFADRGDHRAGQHFHERRRRTNGERGCERRHVDVGRRRPQHGARVARDRMHAVAQCSRVRRRHELAPGAHEQLIAGGEPQPRERAAHGGCAQAKPARGTRHAAFRQQRVERGNEVQVDVFHADRIRHCAVWHGVRCNYRLYPVRLVHGPVRAYSGRIMKPGKGGNHAIDRIGPERTHDPARCGFARPRVGHGGAIPEQGLERNGHRA